MLTRRAWALMVGAAVVACGSLLQSPALADGGKVVCDIWGKCRVVASDTQESAGQPGGHGKPASSGGSSVKKPKCHDSLQSNVEVPCTLDGLGTWSNAHNCYFKAADLQPPAGDPAREGHAADDGAVYNAYCPNNPNMQNMWFAQPPNGAAAAVDPRVLALQAVKKMTLLGPDIGIAPKPGGKGVVGMPVWMWANDAPNAWGPVVASASAGAVTVTATAKVSKVAWSMGDGSKVVCNGRGTAYKAAFGKKVSPDCGYRYDQPSTEAPSGKYHVTATATWTIDWQGGGQSGQLTEVRANAVDITVAEVQVLN
ncbi:ATP/GTP-binding protein [Streptomyces sp. NPDC059893]|uniref:ATP/GTP-binding protein n=1 Tax=Streptomyces sp. NPDC059893 TaxID=3346990 RepID=UPI00365A445F